ncbi:MULTISPECIES: ABC transporter ATP-binding protein [Methylotenera]|uniref:ABC transporter ATP-binding protein n=1 Tax=Methylotenera TaxID=359407 RepID=UPI000373D989|nr:MULTISPECIES: ABC transporter ATP-binding protein [Methylotenera]
MYSAPLIQVKQLTFEYPGTRALDSVNVDIISGSITALVGPNGAGKSTLLRCIAALDYPLSGQVLFNGVDVLDDPRASHAKIGYLSDNFGLYDALSVRQCLTFAASSQGVTADNITRVVNKTAEQLDLTNKLNSAAGVLSRGQRQRVAIGQAIIHSPSLLLLDEPASGLDPEARHSLSQVFIALKNSGMTLIVSSHILAELEDYSTEMLVLKNGRILQQQSVHNSATENLSRIEFELVHIADATKLAAFIDNTPAANALEIAANVANLQLDETLMPRHVLLNRLLQSDISISRFGLLENNMQQNYLKAVNAESITS